MKRKECSMKTSWIETASGFRLDLPNPRAEQIKITDIAWALSMKCHFGGAAKQFFSIAEHSVGVADVLNDLGFDRLTQLRGLLHDAAEAYLGDCITPLKEILPEYGVIEEQVQSAILESLGLCGADRDRDSLVKTADLAMLAAEGDQLMPSKVVQWADFHPGQCFVQVGPLACLKPFDAYTLFLTRFASLWPESVK